MAGVEFFSMEMRRVKRSPCSTPIALLCFQNRRRVFSDSGCDRRPGVLGDLANKNVGEEGIFLPRCFPVMLFMYACPAGDPVRMSRCERLFSDKHLKECRAEKSV